MPIYEMYVSQYLEKRYFVEAEDSLSAEIVLEENCSLVEEGFLSCCEDFGDYRIEVLRELKSQSEVPCYADLIKAR